jgi:hypothetical protein
MVHLFVTLPNFVSCNSFHGCFVSYSKKGQSVHTLSSFFLSFVFSKLYLISWVPPCLLLGWWFRPWELWLADIIVLPMGLQTLSDPSILSLILPLGTLWSFQWLAASICLCICQALAEALRRQLYQALSASTCWHPQQCLGLVIVYGMDLQVGQSGWRPNISNLTFSIDSTS